MSKLGTAMSKDELRNFIRTKEVELHNAKHMLDNYDEQFSEVRLLGIRYDNVTMRTYLVMRSPVNEQDFYVPVFESLADARDNP